jgi:phosphoserine phosphatase
MPLQERAFKKIKINNLEASMSWPGIPELVKKLQGRGTDVFLVSGGFREIINPVAETLGIPRDHVFANTILFKASLLNTMSQPYRSVHPMRPLLHDRRAHP